MPKSSTHLYLIMKNTFLCKIDRELNIKFPKIQKWSDRQKSTGQVSNIPDACIKFENYLIKNVGDEAFHSYYILYHYFKISKIRQKFKNGPIVKKAQARLVISYLMTV